MQISLGTSTHSSTSCMVPRLYFVFLPMFVCYLELGDQLGHMFTLLLWLNHTFLLRLLTDNSLYFVVTLLWSLTLLSRHHPHPHPHHYNKTHLCEGAALGSTELSGLLVTAGHRGVLRHRLLGQRTLLLRPGLTVGLGLVANSLVLALLLLHRLAGHHVVLHLHTRNKLWCGVVWCVVWLCAELRSLRGGEIRIN